MMVKENKIEFIKELETLMHKTRMFKDLVIEVGYREYKGDSDDPDRWEFIPCEEKPEWLLLRWKEQDSRFGRLVPIDGDSCWGIMIDFMKVAERM